MIIAFVIVTIAYTITALLSYFRGKKAKVDPAKVSEDFTDIAIGAIDLIDIAETAFKSVSKGGTLKLKDVLNDIKEQCEERNIEFDKSYWTDFIGKAVNLLNYGRTDDKEPDDTTKVE